VPTMAPFAVQLTFFRLFKNVNHAAGWLLRGCRAKAVAAKLRGGVVGASWWASGWLLFCLVWPLFSF